MRERGPSAGAHVAEQNGAETMWSCTYANTWLTAEEGAERRKKRSVIPVKINRETSRDTCARSRLIYLFVSYNIYVFLFFFSFYITLLAQLYLYTVHIHNSSFTLYMHTHHEYLRCLKVIASQGWTKRSSLKRCVRFPPEIKEQTHRIVKQS